MIYYLGIVASIFLVGIICVLFSGQIADCKEKIFESNLNMNNLKRFWEKNFGSRLKQDKSEQTNVIVTFKGSRYDITDFLSYHPGGKNILIQYNGKDVEQAMLDRKHSIHAYEKLKNYKLSTP